MPNTTGSQESPPAIALPGHFSLLADLHHCNTRVLTVGVGPHPHPLQGTEVQGRKAFRAIVALSTGTGGVVAVTTCTRSLSCMGLLPMTMCMFTIFVEPDLSMLPNWACNVVAVEDNGSWAKPQEHAPCTHFP
jgi:hypothetical protein